MNATIITIGSRSFLLPSPAKGSKIVELLAGAIPVDYEYSPGNGRRMWKTVSHEDRATFGVSMEIVAAEEIAKPLKRVPEARRLGYTPCLPDPVA